jgi:hypothetical protein
MIRVRPIPVFEAETRHPTKGFAAMAAYHEELPRAGVLLDDAVLRLDGLWAGSRSDCPP